MDYYRIETRFGDDFLGHFLFLTWAIRSLPASQSVLQWVTGFPYDAQERYGGRPGEPMFRDLCRLC